LKFQQEVANSLSTNAELAKTLVPTPCCQPAEHPFCLVLLLGKQSHTTVPARTNHSGKRAARVDEIQRMGYVIRMTQTLNSAELDELLAAGKQVVVDFFGTWCQPYKMMAPAVDALQESLAVVKVDIEEGHEAAAKFKVRGVPTFMVFKDGQPVATKTGAMGKLQFIDWANASVA
jgi:thioredoxin 1